MRGRFRTFRFGQQDKFKPCSLIHLPNDFESVRSVILRCFSWLRTTLNNKDIRDGKIVDQNIECVILSRTFYLFCDEREGECAYVIGRSITVDLVWASHLLYVSSVHLRCGISPKDK